MWRRSLIGLLAIVFLTAAGAMVFLTLDDVHDLSGRASGGVSSEKRQVLKKVTLMQGGIGWEGHVSYDPLVWETGEEGGNVFWNKQEGISVRLLAGGSINDKNLTGFLGNGFESLNQKQRLQQLPTNWAGTEYKYSFLGKAVSIEIWSNKVLGVEALAVIGGKSDDSVRRLVAGVISGSVLGATSAPDETARMTVLARPSVVMILAKYCNKLSGFNKTYPFCVWSSGSGFFINKDGYIGTNGHVVKFDDNQIVKTAISLGELKDLSGEVVSQFVKMQTGKVPDGASLAQQLSGIYTNKEELAQLALQVSNLVGTVLTKDTAKINYYVQLGRLPIAVDADGSVKTNADVLEAALTDVDFGNYDPTNGFSGSDVAILKVEGSNFPALPLGSIDNLTQGSEILVLGYPAVVSGLGSSILDYSATTETTVTRGVISAVKEAKGDKKKLLQTDATINKGNSGGPALDSGGRVIGIATYGVTADDGGGNFNFLRDIADLKKLMQNNAILNDIGSTYSDWKSGLDNYWLSYFRYAANNFNKVLIEYPQHPLVGSYISETKQKLGGIEDKTPLYTRTERRILMGVSGAVMAGSLLGMVVLVVGGYLESRAKRKPVTTF